MHPAGVPHPHCDSLLNNSKKATDAEFVGNVLRIYLETVKRHKLICQVFPKE